MSKILTEIQTEAGVEQGASGNVLVCDNCRVWLQPETLRFITFEKKD